MGSQPRSFAEAYRRDGYVFPLRVMGTDEAADYRQQLEAVERHQESTASVPLPFSGRANLVLPFIHEITLRSEILDPVSALLGPDLLVWGCSLFIKEPRSAHFVGWHQDLTYWGLDDAEEVTAWLALSPATPESGCMRFVPGSHREAIVPHRDTFDTHSQLTRGQELAVEVDETQAVDVVLEPGEISLHHGHTFHASHANRSADRRIGIAIRYITPRMRQRGGVKAIAVLARGEDRYNHFELAPAPTGVMHPDDVARMQRASALLNPILYDGAEPPDDRATP